MRKLFCIAILSFLAATVAQSQVVSPNSGGDFDLAKPSNQTGLGTIFSAAVPTGGTTTLQGSGSYTYGVPLFRKSGRAGMDLDLTLYYNSHIWVVSNGATMGADHNTPAPGFQLNFGFIEWTSWTGSVGGVVTTPDGSKHFLSNDISNMVPNAPPPNNTSYSCANLICLYDSVDST